MAGKFDDIAKAVSEEFEMTIEEAESELYYRGEIPQD